MRLTVLSHKPCWRSNDSPSGFTTDGGFPFQMRALSELFDETRLLVPVRDHVCEKSGTALCGQNFHVVPLTARKGRGLSSKVSFIPWLLKNASTIFREVRSSEAIHAPVPGDVGTVGMLLAGIFHKPLFVRHCGNWLKPVTSAEKFWRRFMEARAGGRNVMLATGGTASQPSSRNGNIRWIFASSLTRQELQLYARPPLRLPSRAARLIIVARQEIAKGAGTIIRSLPLLAGRFPDLSLDVVGNGSAIPEFKREAELVGVSERVCFTGNLSHEQVMKRLQQATLFVFPTTSSDGFPKAVLEALASGLPVVATRVSVLPQLLGGGSGVLIDEATPLAVARGVEQAMGDSVEYEAMSRRATETAQQYSLETWRDMIGGMLAEAWGPLRGRRDGS